jgi:lipopolysaccharide/colanic/teichoic acid biosynthesis glycosyltransferase
MATRKGLIATMSSQPFRTIASRQMAYPKAENRRFGNGSALLRHRELRADERSAIDESVEIRVVPHRLWYLPIKAVIDFCLGIALLILTCPVTLVAAILVKLTSRGPAFYSQTRLGKDGRPYRMFKLRTMVDKAEALTGPTWSTGNDVRVTPLGWVLRKTHIDEFPQLWNVIRGEMSLIGPRPERPEIASKLEWDIPSYRERLNVRPGITGFAQVRLPPDTDIESVRRKIVYDVYYVQNVSAWLDFQLLVVTGWSLIVELNRVVWRRFVLPGPEAVHQGFLQAVSAPVLNETTPDSMPAGVSD